MRGCSRELRSCKGCEGLEHWTLELVSTPCCSVAPAYAGCAVTLTAAVLVARATVQLEDHLLLLARCPNHLGPVLNVEHVHK